MENSIDCSSADEALFRSLEREFLRLAQELHDGLCQQLTGLWFLTELLESDLRSAESPHAETAAKITGKLKTAAANTRWLAFRLRPFEGPPERLPSALQALAAQVLESFGVPSEVNCPPDAYPRELSTATHLYRVAQDAVISAVLRRKATRLGIQVAVNSGVTSLEVSDDGAPVKTLLSSANGSGGSLGSALTQRAAHFGAQITWSRRKAGRQTFYCTFPTSATPSGKITPATAASAKRDSSRKKESRK